ncbi:hypothetical protein ACFPPD_20430, partial [Cohnella suwonensis]
EGKPHVRFDEGGAGKVKGGLPPSNEISVLYSTSCLYAIGAVDEYGLRIGFASKAALCAQVYRSFFQRPAKVQFDSGNNLHRENQTAWGAV